MKRLTALLFVLLTCALQAGPTFYGEALYWRPTGDSFDYALQTGQTFTLRSDYDWGVRLGALWHDRGPCFAGDFWGLYLRFLDVANTSAGMLTLPFGAGTGQTGARASLKREYWAAGVRVRRYLHADECLSFYLTAGARFAEVNEWRRVSSSVFAQETLKFRGAGPEVGVGGSWSLLRCLDLKGAVYVTPIVGERKSRLRTDQTRSLFPNSTVISPMIDAKLAAYLQLWRVGFEVGYEIDHYWNALIPSLGFVGGPARIPEDFGFAGPYLRLSAGF